MSQTQDLSQEILFSQCAYELYYKVKQEHKNGDTTILVELLLKGFLDITFLKDSLDK